MEYFTIKQIVKKYNKSVIISFVASFFIAIIGLSFGKIIQKLIDNGIKTNNISNIEYYIKIMIFLSLFFCIFSFIRSFYSNIIAEKIGNDIILNIYNCIIKSKNSLYKKFSKADINNILIDDINKIKYFFATQISYFVRNIIMFFSGIILLFKTSIFLFGCLLITTVSILFVVALFLSVIKKYNKNISIFNVKIINRLLRGIEMKKIVQIFNLNDVKSEFINENTTLLLKNIQIKHLLRSAMVSSILFICLFSATIYTFFAAKFVLNGEITAGEFSSFLIYMIVVISSLIGISNFRTERQIFIVSKNKITEILSLENDKNTGLITIKYNITINKITYNKTFNSFSANILHGKKNIIIGKSGIGKTTIIDLILGFENIDSGSILIDNIDISDINISAFREKISVCYQNTDIFDISVVDNIFYGNIFNERKYINILEDLNILHLKNVENSQLSVGEKQRICVARALLKNNAELFIFDEPTSSLDVLNKDLIWKAIDKYAVNKTIIIITHDNITNNTDDLQVIRI